MFTGIVESKGKIESIEKKRTGYRLILTPDKKFTRVKLGDSISVNGACLTVSVKAGQKFSFDVIQETLRKTNLSTLKKNSVVNLERALKFGDRMNGHYVMGHIDGTGKVISVIKTAKETAFKIRFEKKLAEWIVPKGCIAVNGVSLTVGDVKNQTFSLYLIPHTLKETTFGTLSNNDIVNLEVDILLKKKAWNRKTDSRSARTKAS